MNPIEILLLLLIAGVCGAIGQSIAGSSRGGWLTAIAVGFIGALVGVWIARTTGLPELFVITIDDTAFPIVWSILGSALFVALISFLTRGRGKA